MASPFLSKSFAAARGRLTQPLINWVVFESSWVDEHCCLVNQWVFNTDKITSPHNLEYLPKANLGLLDAETSEIFISSE